MGTTPYQIPEPRVPEVPESSGFSKMLSSIPPNNNKIRSRPSRLRAWLSGTRCLHLALVAFCLLIGKAHAAGTAAERRSAFFHTLKIGDDVEIQEFSGSAWELGKVTLSDNHERHTITPTHILVDTSKGKVWVPTPRARPPQSKAETSEPVPQTPEPVANDAEPAVEDLKAKRKRLEGLVKEHNLHKEKAARKCKEEADAKQCEEPLRPTTNGERVYFTTDACPVHLRYDLFKLETRGKSEEKPLFLLTRKTPRLTVRDMSEKTLGDYGIRYVGGDQQKLIAAKLTERKAEAAANQRKAEAETIRKEDAEGPNLNHVTPGDMTEAQIPMEHNAVPANSLEQLLTELRAMKESVRKDYLYSKKMKLPVLIELAKKMSIKIHNENNSGSRKTKRAKKRYKDKNELVKEIIAYMGSRRRLATEKVQILMRQGHSRRLALERSSGSLIMNRLIREEHRASMYDPNQ